MKKEYKVLIGILALIAIVYFTAPPMMATWLLKVTKGEQPQYCISFADFGTLCPGDEEFNKLFHCESPYSRCPAGMTCTPSGACVEEQKGEPISPVFIIVIGVILIYLWIKRED